MSWRHNQSNRRGRYGSSLTTPFQGGLVAVAEVLERRKKDGYSWVELLLLRDGCAKAVFLPLAVFDRRKSQRSPGVYTHSQLHEDTAQRFAEVAHLHRQRAAEAASLELSTMSISEQETPEITNHAPRNRPSVFSVLVHPAEGESSKHYQDIDHTAERAMNWLMQSQSSGVAVDLLTISTEAIPLAYHRKMFNEMRKPSMPRQCLLRDSSPAFCGVRLWLQPQAEISFELSPTSSNANSWGMTLTKTPQGFIFLESVDEGGEAAACGALELLRVAVSECRLVLRTINGMSVLPRLLSNGSIVMASLEDITKVLALHLRARKPATIGFIISLGVRAAARSVQQTGEPASLVMGTAASSMGLI